MQEPILEPLLRKLRMKRILPSIKQYPKCRLLDVGCGWDAVLLREVEPYIDSGVGIDLKAPSIFSGKIKTYQAVLEGSLSFPDNSFDVVTMLAVLEHLDDAPHIVNEVLRVLTPGGIFIGTVPSKASKPVLEFLSYRMGIVNPDEIRDHKCYYDRFSLKKLLEAGGFYRIQHQYFQLGMNNFFRAHKY